MKFLKAVAHRLGRSYIRRICREEEEHQEFSFVNERPIEYRFALDALIANGPRSVLDVGSGTTCWPKLVSSCGFSVTAIDNVTDYWSSELINRHWAIRDVDIMNPGGKLQSHLFDVVTCISVIEHIHDHARAMKGMAEVVKPGGMVILTTPFAWSNPDPNVYLRADALYGGDLEYICRSSSRDELQQWLACGFRLEYQELWRLFTGPVWATGERCVKKRVESESELHQLGCFIFRKT